MGAPADPSAWLLTAAERDNPHTGIDARHRDGPGDGQRDGQAWSPGNEVVTLVHGAAYFRALHAAIEATRAGDLVLFTDWQGDADERLTGEPGSEIVEVLARAHHRGVVVHGLVWRSHLDQTGFFATENRHLGEQLKKRGIEVLLDMRVRSGGSHHQKFVVVRHRDDPGRDVAFVGGIDLAHNRRDDEQHHGDPQSQPLTSEYGDHPPWHDVHLALRGPVVHDVETAFRERWTDPAPVSRAPWRRLADHMRGLGERPEALPEQWPPPPSAGECVVQLLRTYPDLGLGRRYPFAPDGERSVARGYAKAIGRAEQLVYVEDQYFWGHDVGRVFARQLREHPELRLIVVMPLVPDLAGLNRVPQLLGRERSLGSLLAQAPGRVGVYGLENHAGTPVYVHAKVCVVDDTWATTGSDNFSRRSWTHDSELTAAVLSPDHALDLRLTLAAEHLDRLDDVGERGLRATMADCVDPRAMFDRFAEAADALDGWHRGGRVGQRPRGRLRRLEVPRLSPAQRRWAALPLDVVHDPDGRPPALRRTGGY